MIKNRKFLFHVLVVVLGITSKLTLGVSHAQPEPPPLPPAQQMQQQWMQRLQNMTPEQRQQIQQFLQNMTPEQRRRMQQQTQQFLQNMTPEQRQQLQQQMQPLLQNMAPEQRQQLQQWLQTPEQQREAWIRQVAEASGFKDVKLQDDLIAFIEAQEKARTPLRAAAFALSKSLINPALTDEQLKTTMAGFRESVAKDQERYKTDLAVLDEKIHYSTQPRLELMLGVLGVVGPETATLGGVGAIFPESGFGGSLLTNATPNNG
ncbi:hypothetical protein IAD21_06275 [Abditibacteriota bacterium]|nr:hypothetical protein IAD21_06275 [Abditibacteriota bacterium]